MPELWVIHDISRRDFLRASRGPSCAKVQRSPRFEKASESGCVNPCSSMSTSLCGDTNNGDRTCNNILFCHFLVSRLWAAKEFATFAIVSSLTPFLACSGTKIFSGLCDAIYYRTEDKQTMRLHDGYPNDI